MTILNQFPGGSNRIIFKDYYTHRDNSVPPTFYNNWKISFPENYKTISYYGVCYVNEEVYLIGGFWATEDGEEIPNRTIWKIDDNGNFEKYMELGAEITFQSSKVRISTDYYSKENSIYACEYTTDSRKAKILTINLDTKTCSEREYSFPTAIEILENMEVMVIYAGSSSTRVFLVGGNRLDTSTLGTNTQAIFYTSTIDANQFSYFTSHYKASYCKTKLTDGEAGAILCYGGYSHGTTTWTKDIVFFQNGRQDVTNNTINIYNHCFIDSYTTTDEENKTVNNIHLTGGNQYIIFTWRLDTGMPYAPVIKKSLTLSEELNLFGYHPIVYQGQYYYIFRDTSQILFVENGERNTGSEVKVTNSPIPQLEYPLHFKNQYLLFLLNESDHYCFEYPKKAAVFIKANTTHNFEGTLKKEENTKIYIHDGILNGYMIPPKTNEGQDNDSELMAIISKENSE